MTTPMGPTSHAAVTRITGLPVRTTTHTLPHMVTRNRPDPDREVALAFRDRIGRLERPERRAADGALVRLSLARSHPAGLRERLGLVLDAHGRPA
jgi:hypothetical protein